MASKQSVEPTKQTKLIGILLITVQCVFFMVTLLGSILKYDALIFVLMVIFMGAIITVFAIKTKFFIIFWQSNTIILAGLTLYLWTSVHWNDSIIIFIPLLLLNTILGRIFLHITEKRKKTLALKADG